MTSSVAARMRSEALVDRLRPRPTVRQAPAAASRPIGTLADIVPLPSSSNLPAECRVLDDKGRFSPADTLVTLEWRPGTDLRIRHEAPGVIVITPTTVDASTRVDARGRISIPLVDRARSGLRPGGPVLIQQCSIGMVVIDAARAASEITRRIDDDNQKGTTR